MGKSKSKVWVYMCVCACVSVHVCVRAHMRVCVCVCDRVLTSKEQAATNRCVVVSQASRLWSIQAAMQALGGAALTWHYANG